MKSVWLIEKFDAEPYESYANGIHSVWSSKELAYGFYNNNRGVLGTDPEEYISGYILREPYEVFLDAHQ